MIGVAAILCRMAYGKGFAVSATCAGTTSGFDMEKHHYRTQKSPATIARLFYFQALQLGEYFSLFGSMGFIRSLVGGNGFRITCYRRYSGRFNNLVQQFRFFL